MIYRKINRRMWGDQKFRSLTPLQPSGQALWIWLLAGPFMEIIPGLIMAGEMAMAERLNWTLDSMRDSMRDILKEGLARADFKVPLVWLPNAIKHNAPNSPNVIKGWKECWEQVPECSLRDQIPIDLKSFICNMSKSHNAAFDSVFGAHGIQSRIQSRIPSGIECRNRDIDIEGEEDIREGHQNDPGAIKDLEKNKKKNKIDSNGKLFEESLTDAVKSPGLEKMVKEIFQTWSASIPGDVRHRLLKANRQLIVDRLEDGYSQLEISDAVQGWKNDTFADRGSHNTLKYLIGDGERLEKFMGLHRNGMPAKVGRLTQREHMNEGARMKPGVLKRKIAEAEERKRKLRAKEGAADGN